MYQNFAIFGILSVLILFSFASTAEAYLWDLFIELNLDKAKIYPNDAINVTGKVVDQAYNPANDAKVTLRIGVNSTTIFTDNAGAFNVSFADLNYVPGTHTITAEAHWNELKGLTHAQFYVKGDITKVSLLQNKLATEEARKYLGSVREDYEKDIVGLILFDHYTKLLQELVDELKNEQQSLSDKANIQKQREEAELDLQSDLELLNTGFGVYDGHNYNLYISSLDPKIKTAIKNQLDYTKTTFEHAQIAYDDIIANGGTRQEAHNVYLDMLSITQKELDALHMKSVEYLIPDEEQSTDTP